MTSSSFLDTSSKFASSTYEWLRSFIVTADENRFDTVLEKLKLAKARNPTRGELIDLVADFNRTMLPKISGDGVNFLNIPIYSKDDAREKFLEVRYDSRGYLEIIDGPVAPLDISCRQVLTSTQRAEMQKLYKKLSDNAYYNNLGELLEFINYFAKGKKANPHLTLKNSFDSYKPNLIDVFDKYRSGTCILLSTKFCHELEQIGIQAEKVGKSALNNWTSLPIPGTEACRIKWFNFSEEISGADHTNTVCFFRNENGHEGVLDFACSFEKNKLNEIQEHLGDGTYSGVTSYLVDNPATDCQDRPNKIIDPETIGKARLKGRFKAIMTKDKMTLGIDFLNGNFYINPSWATTIPGIPLNAKKMASIDLEDLAKPNELGTYCIDSCTTELSHRTALRIILDKARSQMVIPDDMEENIIALAQNSKAFFDEIFIQPLPFIKAHYQELLAIGKKMGELEEKVLDCDTFTKALKEEYTNFLKKFNEVICCICECNYTLASEKIIQFKGLID